MTKIIHFVSLNSVHMSELSAAFLFSSFRQWLNLLPLVCLDKSSLTTQRSWRVDAMVQLNMCMCVDMCMCMWIFIKYANFGSAWKRANLAGFQAIRMQNEWRKENEFEWNEERGTKKKNLIIKLKKKREENIVKMEKRQGKAVIDLNARHEVSNPSFIRTSGLLWTCLQRMENKTDQWKR